MHLCTKFELCGCIHSTDMKGVPNVQNDDLVPLTLDFWTQISWLRHYAKFQVIPIRGFCFIVLTWCTPRHSPTLTPVALTCWVKIRHIHLLTTPDTQTHWSMGGYALGLNWEQGLSIGVSIKIGLSPPRQKVTRYTRFQLQTYVGPGTWTSLCSCF